MYISCFVGIPKKTASIYEWPHFAYCFLNDRSMNGFAVSGGAIWGQNKSAENKRAFEALPKTLMYTLCCAVGNWKNQMWRGKGDSFSLSPHQWLCSLRYLHRFWVCRQIGSKTNLRFSLTQLVFGLEHVT